jgi:hypothetical protein
MVKNQFTEWLSAAVVVVENCFPRAIIPPLQRVLFHIREHLLLYHYLMVMVEVVEVGQQQEHRVALAFQAVGVVVAGTVLLLQ